MMLMLVVSDSAAKLYVGYSSCRTDPIRFLSGWLKRPPEPGL